VIARSPVTLGRGDAALSIPMPAVASFVVTFDESPGISSIQIQTVDADGTPSDVIANGSPADRANQVEFSDFAIVPGRYRLVARDVGDMWVDLPGPERLVFRPRLFNALQVRTNGYSAGHLQEAGLRNGDVVVAIDGSELESKLQADACLALARTHDTAKLTVLRGGRRLEIAVDPKRLDDGGALAPWVR